jgi:hypothetical protein
MFCNNNFICFEIMISIIIGAIVAVLFASGLIPFITTVAWIFFGISLLILVLYIWGLVIGVINFPNAITQCLDLTSCMLLTGVIGTLITSIIAISIVLIPALAAVVALVAIMAFFFSIMIISLVCYIVCIVSKL